MPQENFLGCILSPKPAGMPSVELLLGAGEIPELYVVPAYRDCFREQVGTDINGVTKKYLAPIPEILRPRVMNQGPLDSCVGHGTSVQKSAQEGVRISPRDIFRLAKRLDGYGLEAFGTTLAAAQDALVETGAAEDQLVKRDPAMGRSAYLSIDDVTPEVKASRAKHKARRPYYVPRTLIRQTLISYGFPLVTSAPWYAQDSAIGKDGIMRPPTSLNWQGHCFAAIAFSPKLVAGRWQSADIHLNSFGADWGDNGLFYVPQDGTQNRIGNAYVSIDVDPTLAQVLAQYNGLDVKVANSPNLWFIQGGKRRRYPNEIVWWAHGRLFGQDIYEIDQVSLETIPTGDEMRIEDAPTKMRELVRQIRGHYGHQ